VPDHGRELTGPDVRIGDREREAALAVLGEHLTAGRITLDEYGDRSARATQAQTRGQLTALFDDLPEPHPDLGGGAGVVPVSPAPVVRRDRAAMRRTAQAAVPLMWLLTVGVVSALGWGEFWWLVFVPIALSTLAGQLWRDDDSDSDERERRELEG
jgi:hypothetical protein